MDPRFPDWYRAAAIEPQDEFLRKRWPSVEDLASSIDETEVLELARFFHGVPPADQAFSATFETAVQKHDAAFTMSSRSQEVPVLAAAVMTRVLERPSELADVAALAVVVPHCQGAGLNGSVPAIIPLCRAYLTTRAQQQREHRSTTSIGSEPLNVDAQLGKVEAAGDDAGKDLAAALKPVVARINALVNTVAELEQQQRYFREESDVLWWMTGGQSRDLQVAFASLPAKLTSLVAGKELADLVASTVGPYGALAFLDRVLRTADATLVEPVQLSDAIVAADVSWAQSWVDGAFVGDAQDFCPVALALRELVNCGKDAWVAAYRNKKPVAVAPNTTLPGSQLALQVYEESLLLNTLRRSKGGS